MNIYNLLNEIIIVKKHCLSESIYSELDMEKLETEADKQLFVLMRNVSSLATRVTTNNISFRPHGTWEGKRTFAIEDLTEEDYSILAAINISQLPLCLQARISDILWVHKKNYESAKSAAKAYQEMYRALFTVEDWVGTLKYIIRAICISKQINEGALYFDSCKLVYDQIIALSGKDKDYLSLRLLDILVDYKYGETSSLLAVLECIISSNQNNPLKVEQAYTTKISLLKMNKDSKAVTCANLKLADYYANHTTKIGRNDLQSCFRSENLMKKAIVLYRDNKEAKKAEAVHRKLVELQAVIPGHMTTHECEIDTSKATKRINDNMVGLTFEESILRIALMMDLFHKDTIKRQLIDELSKYPHYYMGGRTVINASGQTILVLPPLAFSDPEKDSELLDMYINQKLVESADIFGFFVGHALYYIKQNYAFTQDSLGFLINDNPIIPEGREYIFLSAIFMILNGQILEGMHILAPQTENLFRTIAKEAGGLTVTLENDGTSKEKVLGSVFDIPELVDCYDNDILFVFKALLNEQSGANIRNEIAHGLVNEAKACSGVYQYFVGAVIKLLFFTSRECHEIYRESQRLRELAE